MSNWFVGRFVPTAVPGGDLKPEDMARVSPGDWAEIGVIARGYCRTVDATRSRKRMDGSATVARDGFPAYGTDDVSDDVTQDAVLLYARRLRDVLDEFRVIAYRISDRAPWAWAYVRKDGGELTVDRRTLLFWAVRDAAQRNGYRADVEPDPVDATPGEQVMRGVAHAEHVATAALVSARAAQMSQVVWDFAIGDGSGFRTVSALVRHAGQATDLGRAGVLAKTAQELYGGVRGSSRQVQRVKREARREFRELSQRLDEVRDQLIYRGILP